MAKYLLFMGLLAAAVARYVVAPVGVRGQGAGGDATPTSVVVLGPLGEWVEFPQAPGAELLPSRTSPPQVTYDPTDNYLAGNGTSSPTPTVTETPTATPTDSGMPQATPTDDPLVVTVTTEASATPDLSITPEVPSATPVHTETPWAPTPDPAYATEIPISDLTATPGVWGPTVEPTATETPTPTPTGSGGGGSYRTDPIVRVDGERSHRPRSGSRGAGILGLNRLDGTPASEGPGEGLRVSTTLVDASLWSGDASISIPLDLPPGPNGHAPSLALSYSSNVVLDTFIQGSSGIGQEQYHITQSSPFGYGWDISGIPVISAVPMVSAFGDADQFDSVRGYSLSVGGESVRLVFPRLDETRNQLTDNRYVFQTYPQRFMYVARTRKKYDNPNYPDTSCWYEDRWEVITKDGMHYEFGSPNNMGTNAANCPNAPIDRDAVMRMRFSGGIKNGMWYATRTWDTWANSIRYTYRREEEGTSTKWDAAVTIKEINYSGKHEVTPTPFPAGTPAAPVRGDNRAKIVFIEQGSDREDCVIRTSQGDWVCGQAPPGTSNYPHRSKRLIDRIEISIKNQNDAWELQKRYQLKYNYRTRTVSGYNTYKRAMLAMVYESDGKSSEKALPPHRMTYRVFPDVTPPATPDPIRINWLPLETYDNGYGELVKFTYQGNVFATCDGHSHERRPVQKKEIYNRAPDGTMPLISKHEYEYHGSQKCTEKYGHDIDGGPYESWYEFLGFGQVTETIKDASDQVVKNTTTNFYRCVDEAGGCPDAGGGAEPHPMKGSLKKEVVRSATSQPPASEKIVDISAPTAVNNHIGYYPTVVIPTPVITYWGKVDRVVEMKYGPVDGTGSNTSIEQVVKYSYDPLRQAGIQSGLVTGETIYLGDEEETKDLPLRNIQRWYTRQEVIDKNDFSVYKSTYIADRISREGVWTGKSPMLHADLLRAAWYYYDFAQTPVDMNRKGSLTRISELEAISAWPPGISPSFSSPGCASEDQKYRSRERQISYDAVTGNPRVEISHPDFGYACVKATPPAAPTPPIAVVATNYPVQQGRREITTEYDTILNALPISIKNPLNHVTELRYYGINVPVTPGSSPTPTPTSTPGYGGAYIGGLFTSIDPNGNAVKHYYDGFGRLTSIMKPDDSVGYSPSIAYSYSDARSTLVPTPTPTSTLTPQATATFPKHYYGMVLPVMAEKWVKREAGGQPTAGATAGVFERTFYDGLGRVVQVQRPHHNWAAATPTAQDVVVYTEYDALSRAVKESNPYAIGKFVGVTGSCGGASQPACNAYVTPDTSRPKTVKVYDVVGRPTSVTGPDGAVVEYRYGVLATPAGPTPTGTPRPTPGIWLEDIVDPNNHRRQRRYDSSGRLLSVVEINGVCQNGWPNHPCSTPVNSQTATPVPWVALTPVHYGYDALDRLVKVNDSLGYPTPMSMTYNQLGHKTKIEDPNLGTWTYEYDGTDSQLSLIDARGSLKVCSYYDIAGRVKSRRYVAPGVTPTPCLPPAGTPTTTAIGTPGPVYSYDSGTNAKGKRTGADFDVSQKLWTYDPTGRVASENHTVNGTGGGSYTTVYSYKANDFVSRLELPSVTGDDSKLDHTYAPNGAVSRIVAKDGTILIDQTTYDASGGVDVRNYGPSAQYVILDQDYDTLNNRLTQSKAGTSGSSTAYQDLRFVYDPVGNVKTISDHKVSPVQTQAAQLDDRDRLKSISVTGGGSGQGDYSDTYQYNDRGNLTSKDGMTYQYHSTKVSAARRRYGSNTPQNKTIQVTAKKTAGCTYGIWADLWVNGVHRASNQFTLTTYETKDYLNIPLTGNDVLDINISGIDLGVGTCALHVDNVVVDTISFPAEGGRMAFDSNDTQDGVGMELPDDAGTYLNVTKKGSLLFAKVSGTATPLAGAYEYDANGNMEFKVVDGKAYQVAWNPENQLSTIYSKRSGSTLTAVGKFNYDADGGRAKAERVGLVDTRLSYYPSEFYEYTERNLGGWNKYDVQEHVFADGKQFRLRQGSNWPPANKYWMLQDHLNSTTKLVAATPSLYSEMRYKAWGETRYESPSYGHPTKKRYTGQREDDWGLYFYNARYYDSQLGRFVSPDTMVPDPTDPQLLNRYTYVKNNPLRYSDPSGHCIEPASFAVCVGVGVVALKVVDYGWTAWDVYSDTKILRDPNSTQEQLDQAAANIAMAAVMEAVEPDELSPIGLPLDDLARHGIIGNADEITAAAKRVVADGSDDVASAASVERVSSKTLRDRWEKATGQKWPKDPNTGRNLDVSHKRPLADGGTNDIDNIEPLPRNEHVRQHKEAGDFRRWGARRRKQE